MIGSTGNWPTSQEKPFLNAGRRAGASLQFCNGAGGRGIEKINM
jgi:hypothetical protein